MLYRSGPSGPDQRAGVSIATRLGGGFA